MLELKNLKVSIDSKEILKGVDLVVGAGELHVLMGPNGSGKSTLAQVLMGSSQFTVHPTSSRLRGASSSPITFEGKDITKLSPDKRARLGIFLGFQHPVEVPGVSVFNFLRRAKQSLISFNTSDGGPERSRRNSSEVSTGRAHLRGVKAHLGGEGMAQFRQELLEYASSLKLSDDILRRSLNEGFSGGEKKRNEILQMMALKPRLVILDEIDSGLDVDGLRLVATAIDRFIKANPKSSILLITHYARILKYLKPDFVHVMVDGKIVKSGKAKLAREIEENGYGALNAKRLTTKAEHLTINN